MTLIKVWKESDGNLESVQTESASSFTALRTIDQPIILPARTLCFSIVFYISKVKLPRLTTSSNRTLSKNSLNITESNIHDQLSENNGFSRKVNDV